MTADRDPVDVLVIGEAIMDIVRDGDTTREYPGGSPANVALGLGRLGINTALLTDLGPLLTESWQSDRRL